MTLPSWHWWRTVFWLIPAITICTIFLGAVSLPSVVFDRKGHFAHRCAQAWSWLILATTGVRVTTSGQGHLSSGQSYVFVSNHQSIYDFPVLITSIPLQLRIIAKASLGLFPVLGWHLRCTGHLLVNRARSGKATLTNVASLMRGGHSLIVFPEGTRSVDGEVLRFKRGLFLLAIEAKLPVVPVSIMGSRHVMKKGQLTTSPGDVALVIHEPLRTDRLGRDDARALADRAHEVITKTIADTERKLTSGVTPVIW